MNIVFDQLSIISILYFVSRLRLNYSNAPLVVDTILNNISQIFMQIFLWAKPKKYKDLFSSLNIVTSILFQVFCTFLRIAYILFIFVNLNFSNYER